MKSDRLGTQDFDDNQTGTFGERADLVLKTTASRTSSNKMQKFTIEQYDTTQKIYLQSNDLERKVNRQNEIDEGMNFR